MSIIHHILKLEAQITIVPEFFLKHWQIITYLSHLALLYSSTVIVLESKTVQEYYQGQVYNLVMNTLKKNWYRRRQGEN